jgi:hypothetical protein
MNIHFGMLVSISAAATHIAIVSADVVIQPLPEGPLNTAGTPIIW